LNFEHLLKKLFLNFRKTHSIYYLIQIKYFLNLRKILKQKLKLGTVAFDITYVSLLGVNLFEKVEMKYSRQDTSFDDSNKIENRLNRLKWKSDVYNFVSLFLILISIFFFIYYQVCFFCNEFITPASLPDRLSLNFSEKLLNTFFNFNSTSFVNLKLINRLLNESLLVFFDFYKII